MNSEYMTKGDPNWSMFNFIFNTFQHPPPPPPESVDQRDWKRIENWLGLGKMSKKSRLYLQMLNQFLQG